VTSLPEPLEGAIRQDQQYHRHPSPPSRGTRRSADHCPEGGARRLLAQAIEVEAGSIPDRDEGSATAGRARASGAARSWPRAARPDRSRCGCSSCTTAAPARDWAHHGFVVMTLDLRLPIAALICCSSIPCAAIGAAMASVSSPSGRATRHQVGRVSRHPGDRCPRRRAASYLKI
jgi:hypothetical protein